MPTEPGEYTIRLMQYNSDLASAHTTIAGCTNDGLATTGANVASQWSIVVPRGVDEAYAFDGVNDRLLTGFGPNLGMSATHREFTVEAWMRSSGITDDHAGVVDKMS